MKPTNVKPLTAQEQQKRAEAKKPATKKPVDPRLKLSELNQNLSVRDH